MLSSERVELRGRILAGRYRVGRLVGSGGTGVVLEAVRIQDNRPLVIKTLKPIFADNRDLVRRLCREAEVSRMVGHPGILPIVDQGFLPDDTPYLVMPRLHGQSLARVLARTGTLTEPEAAVVGARVCAIIQATNLSGYVHRDLKPEHVILSARGGRLAVHVIDFGVCASVHASQQERRSEEGRVFGTPSYASPEQAAGYSDVDGRADVYGMGTVLFESLVGRPPFHAKNVIALLGRIIKEDAPRISSLIPHASGAMDAVVAQALERSLEHRFQSMRELAAALTPILGDRSRSEDLLINRVIELQVSPNEEHTRPRPATVAA